MCSDKDLIAKAPVTPGLRPCYDLPATEKWANRRKNVRLVAEVVRLVAEVVGDRKGQISRSKVKVKVWFLYSAVASPLDRSKRFTLVSRSHVQNPVTPGLRPG